MPQYIQMLVTCWKEIGGLLRGTKGPHLHVLPVSAIFSVFQTALTVLQADGHPTESSASGKLTGPLPWDILDELSDDDDLSTTAGTAPFTLSMAKRLNIPGCIARSLSPSLLELLILAHHSVVR